MPTRDFFTFCTTLRPLERKALGELSHVRHVEEGETIYRVGDPGDTLYIINRGIVEIAQGDAKEKTAGAYLTRGEIFGDTETLLELPRQQIARTCEPVSLQCFGQEDLKALLARVPAFFRYLSEQSALRLLHARDRVLSQSHSLHLSGNFANFDLVTIYQTIVNSSQTGELSISNEQGEPVSAFFFEGGQPRSGKFQHLMGEEAFWQLFLDEDLRGTFSFAAREHTPAEAPANGNITRSSTDMLINAMQARDEFQALKSKLGGAATMVTRRQELLALDDRSSSIPSTLLEEIWQHTASGPASLDELAQRCSVCDLKLYRAVHALAGTGHFALSVSESSQRLA